MYSILHGLIVLKILTEISLEIAFVIWQFGNIIIICINNHLDKLIYFVCIHISMLKIDNDRLILYDHIK